MTDAIIRDTELHFTLIDFKKAFDYINVDQLLCSLFNIGIKDWRFAVLYRFYKLTVSCAEINKIRSDDVNISQGVGQGFAVSGPFFNLVVNNLIILLSQLDISYQVYSIIIFTALYADDMNLYSNSCQGLQQLLLELEKGCRSIAFNFSVRKCKYIQFNVPVQQQSSNSVMLLGKSLVKSMNFTYLGVDWQIYGRKTISIKPHIQKRLNKGTKCYGACIAKNLFGNSLDLKIQFELADTLYKSTLEYGMRLFLYDDTSLDSLDRNYSKALCRILCVNGSSYNKAVFLSTGRIPLKLRNHLQLMSSYHRQMRYNSDSPSRAIITGEYKIFRAKNTDFSNISSSYINDCYKTFSAYDLKSLFNPNEIRTWHKHDYDNHIKQVVLEKTFHQYIKLLKDHKFKLLATSIESIIKHCKADNDYYINCTEEPQIDIQYHKQLYFKNYIYRLIGINSDQSLSKFHKFLISMYFRSHSMYWDQIKGNCRFCNKSWKDPMVHLLYKCKDKRITNITNGCHDEQSPFYFKVRNIHNIVFNYRIRKHIMKKIYKKYRKLLR